MGQRKLSEFYNKRAAEYGEKATALQAKFEKVSFLRLGAFLVFVGLIIGAFFVHVALGITSIFILLFAFVKLVIWHSSLEKEVSYLALMETVNERESAHIQGDDSAFYDGQDFENALHPYTVDLDVFGPHSTYQNINRTSTVFGRKTLAQYFESPASLKEIEERQTAVKELASNLEWRQKLNALGLGVKDDDKHTQMLALWLEDENKLYPKMSWRIALMVIPVFMIGWIIAMFLWIPWQLGLFLFLVPAYLLRQKLALVEKTIKRTEKIVAALSHYAFLVEHIEEQKFESELLTHLGKPYQPTNRPKASTSLKRLKYLLGQLNVRNNIFAIFFNLIGLWDLQWLYRLEEWKEDNRDYVMDWFVSLGEFETLNSLANLHYNREDWAFPTIDTDSRAVKASQLGHPLIDGSVRINNDVDFPTQAHIKLVTGSNMAGKSTFLRTVGINIVYALMGAPVCASSMKLPLLKVHTSMRTKDALHESTSSFFAELKRLKMIIEAVDEGMNTGVPVYFLLDEILKGTNSRDQHKGGKALIQQMIKTGGAGIIATHDLELGNMEAEAAGAVENLCMEVEVEGSELVFDYLLKKGVSQSFNATILMKKMGIDVEIN